MEAFDLLRYFAALLLVLGLLGGFLFIVRRGWIPGLPTIATLTGARGDRRLEVSESLVLDPRRRVVIVKADEEEHVLLLGPERELVLATRPAKEKPVFEPEMPTDVLLEDEPDTSTPADEPYEVAQAAVGAEDGSARREASS